MPKRIFIVDDSKIIRKSVRSHLESRLQHITCAEATDGVDAIQHVNEVQPDRVVLYLCMP
jgi:chemotaxis response regulator CheB